ncbi:MAG: serine hydrolase [Alphaproteobacteria bacterium]|nr:serine hydrolase [Alphaproteobacteria bacterium]
MSHAKSAGFSPARLETLDRVMTQRYVESGMLPGYQTMIWRGGKLAHHSVSGRMDIERDAKWREDAIVRIYSMSKPITAAALMILVEEGALGLDDDVHAHIPSWKNLGVYASGMPTLLANQPPQFLTTRPDRRMKVIDLLTHTAGLTYGFLMRTAVDAAYRKAKINDFQTPGGLEQFIDDLSRIPLEFTPGEAWNYSVSIDVAGYLCEKLSGMPFGEFLRTRLFEPLGMKDTAFYCPPEDIKRFASCYQPGEGGRGLKLQDDARKSTYAAPPKLEAGGGGLVSTAEDYMRFCRMFLGKGALDGAHVLSPKTVQLFSLNHLPGGKQLTDMAVQGTQFSETGYDGLGFSLGCGVNVDVAKTRLPGTLGEFFWGGAASTAFWVDPKEDLAVVFMTQVIGTEARLTLRRDLRTLVYSAMTESYTL